MSDKKISALNSASIPLAGTEVLPIVQNNTTVKATTENIFNAIQPNGVANGVVYLSGTKTAATESTFNYNGENLGVGKTLPGAKGVFAINANNANTVNYLTLRNVASGYGSWGFQKQNSNDLVIGNMADGSDTPNTNILYLNYGGDVNVSKGNLVIGTSGKGIVLKSPNGLITKTLTIDNTGLIALI